MDFLGELYLIISGSTITLGINIKYPQKLTYDICKWVVVKHIINKKVRWNVKYVEFQSSIIQLVYTFVHIYI